MSARYDTNSEVPSNTLPDLNDNMLVFDAFVNQESGSVISRKGVDIPVLQEQVGGRIDALTADAQAALTVLILLRTTGLSPIKQNRSKRWQERSPSAPLLLLCWAESRQVR